MIRIKKCEKSSQELGQFSKLMEHKCTKLRMRNIMEKMKILLPSMKNIKTCMQVIIGKLRNKLRKIAINLLELKIETTIPNNTMQEMVKITIMLILW